MDDYLKLVNYCEETRDTIEISVNEELTVKEVQPQYEYWQCQFNAKDKQDLDNHISVKHAVDESFIFPNSTEEFKCVQAVITYSWLTTSLQGVLTISIVFPVETLKTLAWRR